MIDIIKLLKQNSSVNDYRVKSVITDSYQAFYVHGEIETLRASATEDCTVTVYVDHENGKGESSFSVYNSTTESEAIDKIQLAVNRAKMIANKPYEIVSGGKEEYVIASNMQNYQMNDLCDKIAKAVFSVDLFEFGSLNAVEVFVTKYTTRIQNSRGVDKTQTDYSAMVEAIPTWTQDGESVELYECYRFTKFDESDITNQIQKRIVEVRDRKKAVKPEVPFELDVVISEQEITTLIDEITYQLNYSSVYSKSNVHSIGDKIQDNPTGDKLTVIMKGEIEGSVASAKFDDDGLTLKDKTIISNGEVTSYYGSNRFGQYLGEKEISGSLGCISLLPGSADGEYLKGKKYIELMSLSGLQVDLYNDYIGGEVRLAYIHDENGATPVTGISISGSLKTALNAIKLASKVTVKGYYQGPCFAVLLGLKIV